MYLEKMRLSGEGGVTQAKEGDYLIRVILRVTE